jgi:8-oxo-dGTP diphosphatase
VSDDEAAFLASYDPSRYDRVAVTVDVVALTARDGDLAVLLVERGGHPFKGEWALPGGFLDAADRTLDDGARRELHEETGLDLAPGSPNLAYFAQLGSYGDVGRDPRLRTVTVAYLALVRDLPDPSAAADAADARVWPVHDLALADGTPGAPLAFDHARIVADGVARARALLREDPSLAARLDAR